MTGIQKVFLVAALAVGAVFGWRTIRSALASDEDKVRWVFQDMEHGFNNTRMAPVIGGFAKSYQDESSGVTRAELREILAYLFLRKHDPETKRFRLRVEIDEEALAVAIDEVSRKATVSGAARFFDTLGDEEQIFWDARFEAELVDAGEGWEVVQTGRVNVAEMEDLR